MKQKKLVKAMYVCLFVSCLLSNMLYAKSRQTKPLPGTAIFVMVEINNNTQPIVKTKKLTFNKDYIKGEILVPQIDGLTDKSLDQKLNKELLQEAQGRQKAILKEAKTYAKDLNVDQMTPQFEYLESFTPIKTIKPYFILELFKYQYSGGAHGLANFSYLVIDTDKSEVVSLKDLFKEQVDYRSIINEQISQMIKTREAQGEFFFTGSDGFQSISETQPFYINEQGDLVIVFNVYEIAPYAAGPQYFVIPHILLSSYLK